MYNKHKEDDKFKQKKKEYDMKYYEQNKDTLLSERKHKYDNDDDFKKQIKLKQKNRYDLNKLKNALLKSTSIINLPSSSNADNNGT